MEIVPHLVHRMFIHRLHRLPVKINEKSTDGTGPEVAYKNKPLDQ